MGITAAALKIHIWTFIVRRQHVGMHGSLSAFSSAQPAITLAGSSPYSALCQVWRVGTSNVPRTYETTPWSGCYGAGFDLGTSGGIGIRASSATADKRCAAAF